MPNHSRGLLLPAKAISGLSRVRTKLGQVRVIPPVAPHPVETHGQLPCHGDLGNRSFPSHGQVQIAAPPVGITARRDLRCRDQRSTHPLAALSRKAECARPTLAITRCCIPDGPEGVCAIRGPRPTCHQSPDRRFKRRMHLQQTQLRA